MDAHFENANISRMYREKNHLRSYRSDLPFVSFWPTSMHLRIHEYLQLYPYRTLCTYYTIHIVLYPAFLSFSCDDSYYFSCQ